MHLLTLVSLAKLITPNSGVTSPGDTYYLDRKDGQFLWRLSDRNLPRVVPRRNGMAHRTAMLQKDREIAGTLWGLKHKLNSHKSPSCFHLLSPLWDQLLPLTVASLALLRRSELTTALRLLF